MLAHGTLLLTIGQPPSDMEAILLLRPKLLLSNGEQPPSIEAILLLFPHTETLQPFVVLREDHGICPLKSNYQHVSSQGEAFKLSFVKCLREKVWSNETRNTGIEKVKFFNVLFFKMTKLNSYFLNLSCCKKYIFFKVKPDVYSSFDDSFFQVKVKNKVLRGYNVKRMTLLIYSYVLESKNMINIKKKSNLKSVHH